MYTSRKYPRINDVLDGYLWHSRLGHINKNRMNRLIWEEILKDNDCELLPTCKSYLIEKIIRPSFTKKDEQASDVLGLIYTDVVEKYVLKPII